MYKLNGDYLIIFTILIISFNSKSRSGCEQTVYGAVLKLCELCVAMPFFTVYKAGTP